MAMRLRISRDSQRKLARGAALVVIGGLAAGCSSSASRFGGIDERLHRHHQPATDHPAGRPALSCGRRGFGSADDGLRAGAVRHGRPLGPGAGRRDAGRERRAGPVGIGSSRYGFTRPATGRASAGARRRPHHHRHRSDTVRRPAGAGGRGREGLVERRRHADHRQGRRDRLQPVPTLRRAGRRAR